MEKRDVEHWVVAKHPWVVKEVKFEKEEINFFLELNHETDIFRCNTCNKQAIVMESTYFMWRSFTKDGYNCFVNVKIPKVNCEKHGLHNVDKNKFRRMGHFIELNYSETMIKKSFIKMAQRNQRLS